MAKFVHAVIASKDGDNYEIHAMVPAEWTEGRLQRAVKDAKRLCGVTAATHNDSIDADAIIEALATLGVIAASTITLDSYPVVWDQHKNLEG